MEKVMVINNNYLLQSGLLDYTGVSKVYCSNILQIILDNYEFMARDQAEENFFYKQIIPYVVIKYNRNYLLLKRLKKQTEKRLHNKLSIGVGGHMNNENSDINIILAGLYRELNEEISLEYSKEPLFLGLLNDTTTEVSKVHLGVVYLLETDSPYFIVNEKEKMEASWVNFEELYTNYKYLETWSQIVLDYLRGDKCD